MCVEWRSRCRVAYSGIWRTPGEFTNITKQRQRQRKRERERVREGRRIESERRTGYLCKKGIGWTSGRRSRFDEGGQKRQSACPCRRQYGLVVDRESTWLLGKWVLYWVLRGESILPLQLNEHIQASLRTWDWNQLRTGLEKINFDEINCRLKRSPNLEQEQVFYIWIVLLPINILIVFLIQSVVILKNITRLFFLSRDYWIGFLVERNSKTLEIATK